MSALLYAAVALIIALICGLAPILMGIKENKERLKQLTGIAAGIILASAMLVVIPEGYELATTDEHSAEEALAGNVALVILEVSHGEINASSGIEEIEELLGGHGDVHEEDAHEEDAHGQESGESLSGKIEHVIEEFESGEINASTGIEEIEELISSHSHNSGHEEHASGLLMGGAILAGFLLMFILEGSGMGHSVHEEHHNHEHNHGHGHIHHAAAGGLLVFGLTMHAATDGLAVGAAAASGDLAVTATVLLAVLIHKGPAAFSLGVFSAHERAERKDSIKDVVIFSLATPVMILLANFALSGLEKNLIGLTMLFSAGTFLYVATVDTLPDIHNPETGKKALTYVIMGVLFLTIALIILNNLGIGHAH